MDTEMQDIIPVSAQRAVEQAHVEMQIATAHQFPKHSKPGQLSQIKDMMLSYATLDEETAEAMFYSLPRGNRVIQGPSIRCAEIAISCYGNIRVATRVLDTVTSGPNPHVIVQAAAHDLERNVVVSMEKRRRITKKRSAQTIDEDDINLAVNACTAIAVRDAAFKVVPMALVKPVWLRAKQIAAGDATTLSEKRATVIERLKKFGLTEARILSRIEVKRFEDVDIDLLSVLIGLGTAVKDGEISVDDAFPEIVPAEQQKLGSEGLKARLAAQKGATEESEVEPEKPKRRRGRPPKIQEAETETKADNRIQLSQKRAIIGKKLLDLAKQGFQYALDGDGALVKKGCFIDDPDARAIESLAAFSTKPLADLTDDDCEGIMKLMLSDIPETD